MQCRFICLCQYETFQNFLQQVWTDEQGKLLDELRDQPLDLAGDGRCDSPGFCAKYLTYSLFVGHVNKILHFEQVQVGEVRNGMQLPYCGGEGCMKPPYCGGEEWMEPRDCGGLFGLITF